MSCQTKGASHSFCLHCLFVWLVIDFLLILFSFGVELFLLLSSKNCLASSRVGSGSNGSISEILPSGFLASRRSIFEFFVRMIIFFLFFAVAFQMIFLSAIATGGLLARIPNTKSIISEVKVACNGFCFQVFPNHFEYPDSGLDIKFIRYSN